MSEENSGSFTSRLFRKASANLAPAVTVQVADSPLSTRNSSSSPLAVERAPSFGNVVQSAVSTSNAITQDYILFSQPVIAAGTIVRRRKDGARMLLHFLAELPIGDEFVTVNVLKKIESHITDNLANLPTTPTAAPAAAPAEAK